jgi:hypothetical protein
LAKGPPVNEDTPWVMRVHSSNGNHTKVSSATAVPPLEGERLIRWAFIAQHTLTDAGGVARNIVIRRTEFGADRINRPAAQATRITAPFEGTGDIALVTLVTPIEVPAGVEVPALNWDHVPAPGNATLHLGFGPDTNNELHMARGRDGVLRPNRNHPEWGPVVFTFMIEGATEGGDSGGPVRLRPNGDIVGIHTAGPAPDDPRHGEVAYWTPLQPEIALRQELEQRIRLHNLAVLIDPDAAGGSCMNVTFPDTANH